MVSVFCGSGPRHSFCIQVLWKVFTASTLSFITHGAAGQRATTVRGPLPIPVPDTCSPSEARELAMIDSSE